MAYAVMNIRKQKGNGGALEAHIDRKPGMEHAFRNADPERQKFNISFDLKNHSGTLNERVNARIQRGYKGKKAIRKDAIKFVSLVLTGSHEQMKKIFASPNARKAWIVDNVKFLQEEFGNDNLVKLDLHLDEKTPHLHAIIVPLTADGRLSAKEVVGNKKALKERLTRYAAKMKKYGLQRGLERSPEHKPTPKDTAEFYTTVEKVAKMKAKLEKIDFKAIKSISPRDKTFLLQKALTGEKIGKILDNYNHNRGKKL